MTAAQEIPAPGPLVREDRVDYTPTAHSVTLSRHRAARLVLQWCPTSAGPTPTTVTGEGS
ncbi:hypothetical protein Sfulv_29470 [Streptomyces fulvorobeus]|uniref:Uncharacterized protein n=1 Tax=Streptomyces fulvorobeus TaxID=284028 RepID=A0A7J0C8S5_9ACTN|nr:hypothetical protein [Streptomyces fulvorobeus]GFM98136.1 hypothetical protein Sfulv_29470 [Streptomyces fulvorobeus]